MVSFLLHGCRLQDWSRWLPNSLISETGMITLILGPGETLKQHQEAAWQQVSSPDATAGLRMGTAHMNEVAGEPENKSTREAGDGEHRGTGHIAETAKCSSMAISFTF